MAERIGRSVDTIGAIERGINATRIETASHIALALDVRLPALFEFDEARPGSVDERDQAINTLVASLDGATTETVLKLMSLVKVGLSLTKAGNP